MCLPFSYVFLTCLSSISTVSANTHYSFDPNDPNSCVVLGDPDVYGKGIRIGYYLQWAAVILAVWIAPSIANQARSATNIITISVFINSFRGAHVDKSLMIVEWYIVQQLAFWLLVANIPLSGPAFKRHAGSVATTCLLYAAVGVFPVWLYWFGLHQGAKPGCTPKVIFYAPIHAYSRGWVTFNKVNSVLACIFAAAMVVLAAAVLLRPFVDGDEDQSDVPAFKTGFLLFLGVVSIVHVELTIRFNHVRFPDSPIADSGQLVPLLIGIFTFTATLWKGLQNAVFD